MKKFLISMLVAFFVCTGISYAAGNQWCCSWHGWLSHCWSNWKWICNDGTTSPSCTCGWGYSNSYSNYYTTTYTYKKSCFETYGIGAMDNYDWTCSCMAWYVWWTDFLWNTACITEDQACKNQFWISAKSIWNKQCGCNYWYVMKNGKCVDELSEKITACNLISNSKFNYLSSTCECKDGYIFDGDNCISETQSCQKQYGVNAAAWNPWYCVCKDGYEWNSTRTSCVKSYSYWYTDYSNTTYTCDSYWPNSYLTYDNRCACKEWYEWNNAMTYCVVDRNSKLYWWKDFRSAKDGIDYINMLLDFEDEIDRQEESSKVNRAKWYLWDKAPIVESIAQSLNKKDAKTKKKIMAAVESFKDSNDDYTRSIGFYLWSLME